MSVTQCSYKVPLEMVLKSNGFGLDIGGSLVKIVYTTKEDEEEAANMEPGELATLRCAWVPRPEWISCLEQVAGGANLKTVGTSSIRKIFTTGVGGFAFEKEIREHMKCEVATIGEFDCFVIAFLYLSKRLPRKELLFPFLVEETEEPIEYILSITERVKGTHERGETFRQFNGMPDRELMTAAAHGALRGHWESSTPLEQAEPRHLYPYIHAMIGSAIGYFLVHEDGSYSMVDLSARGGRSMYGMATLLTGCKSFDEILELASRGKEGNVNTGLADLIYGSDVGGVYADLLNSKQNVCAYAFGKAAGADRDTFSKEDLAMAAVFYFSLDIAQSMTCIANANRCRRVFVSGSVTQSELLRRQITREVARRNAMKHGLSKKDDIQSEGVTVDFIKHGSNLGAIGCLLHSFKPFIPAHMGDAVAQKSE